MSYTRLTPCFLRAFTLSGVLLGLSASGVAGTITYITTDFDLGSGWRTSSVPKTDIDPNDVLGTDGWYVAGDEGSTEIPAYLTSLISDGIVFGGDSGYRLHRRPQYDSGIDSVVDSIRDAEPLPRHWRHNHRPDLHFWCDSPLRGPAWFDDRQLGYCSLQSGCAASYPGRRTGSQLGG